MGNRSHVSTGDIARSGRGRLLPERPLYSLNCRRNHLTDAAPHPKCHLRIVGRSALVQEGYAGEGCDRPLDHQSGWLDYERGAQDEHKIDGVMTTKELQSPKCQVPNAGIVL